MQKVVFRLGGDYLLTEYGSPYTFSLRTERWSDGQRTLEVESVMRDGFTSSRASADLSFSNGVIIPLPNTNSFTPSQGTTPAAGRPFVLATAGDGADGAASAQQVTDLIGSWSPNMFLYLGDVYDQGTPTEFHNWYGTGDRFFGRFRSITNPTIGNHENQTPGSAGYFDYWDNVPNFFSFNVAGWHVVSVDSTGAFGQTSPGSGQYQWLDLDLTSSPAPCTIVYFHHPPWTVGPSDNSDAARVRPLWNLMAQHGVDVVLTGHDHDYQRWHALDGSGNLDPAGPTEFVVGTGGHGVQGFIRTDSRLAQGFDTSPAAFGALRLELNQHGTGFQFVDTQGSTLDSGSVHCSGAPADTQSPAAPTNLQATAPSGNRVDLTWTSATDNVGVTGYDVYRNGSFLATTGAAPKYADTTVVSGTTYQYSVRARDAAGNISAPSNTSTVTTPGSVPPLFSDGFETGNMSVWTSNTGLDVQQQEVFSGSWAARGTTTTAAKWAYKQLGSTQSELFFRIRFKVLSQGSSSTVNLLKFRTGTGSSILGLFRNNTGKLGYRNDVAAVSTNSSTTVTTGLWHEAQMRLRINGTSGTSETWFDGTRIAALSKTENFGTASIGRIQLGENSAGRSFDIAFDDVAAATSFIAGGAPPTDTTPPSNPSNLQATAVNSNRVDMTWTASTDNVGVTNYDIYRNGSLLTSVGAVTSYSDTTVSPSTTYSYQVRARDAAGNPSGLSNTATATTPSAADTTPPSNPTNLQANAVNSSRVDLTWTASTDNVGVTNYDIYRNGSLLTSVGAVTSYSDTTVSPSTTYSYQVRARDAAGNPSGLSNTATATTPAASAAVFSDGFETGNFSNWTSNTGLVAQQQEVYQGSWGARGTSTSAATWAYKTLGSTHTELYYRIRFKVISQGASSTVNVLKLRTATGTALFGLFRSSNGNLGYRNEVAAVSTTSTTSVTTGVWHEIQVRVRINGASGETETWFDGVRIASLSKIENFGTTPIGRLQLGENSTGRTYDFAFDTVVASATFIGP